MSDVTWSPVSLLHLSSVGARSLGREVSEGGLKPARAAGPGRVPGSDPIGGDWVQGHRVLLGDPHSQTLSDVLVTGGSGGLGGVGPRAGSGLSAGSASP